MSTMTRPSTRPPLEASPATGVKTNMLYAILSMVLFLPTGLLATYFATKVRPAERAGNATGALEAAKRAKLFYQISLLVGAVLWPLIILAIVAAAGGPSGSGLWYS